jgi:hypothetical protein
LFARGNDPVEKEENNAGTLVATWQEKLKIGKYVT